MDEMDKIIERLMAIYEKDDDYGAIDRLAAGAYKAGYDTALRTQHEREVGELRTALQRAYTVGHDLECLFCGFKDKYITAALTTPTNAETMEDTEL